MTVRMIGPPFPFKQCVEGELADGTRVGDLFHQYKDSPTGCDLIFRGFGAAVAPDYGIEDSHLAEGPGAADLCLLTEVQE